MEQFKEYKIKFLPFNPDLVSGVLWNLEIEGIVENDEDISVFVNSENNEIETSINKVLSSLVKEGIIELFLISSSDVENKNWNEEWEKRLRVVEISDKITIKPTFRNFVNEKNKIVIEIDPKMSFGTGEHPTTKIMINFLEKYIKKNETVLDVGSGTGILSIAAILLGAEKAIAFDVSEWAYMNGKENVKLNNLESRIDVRQAEINEIPEKDFDIILANINTHIILSAKELLVEKLISGGYLFLSGLLYADEDKLIQSFTNFSLQFIEKIRLDDWSGLVFKK